MKSDKFGKKVATVFPEAVSRAAWHPVGTLLEINTGAIFRGYRTTPYPAPVLLREGREMGGGGTFTPPLSEFVFSSR